MRIVTVAGTRPELIKLAPLTPLLAARFDHHYLFTGQHYSPAMVEELFDDFPISTPDAKLCTESSEPEILRTALLEALKEAKPEVVLVYGDTNSTLAAAQAAREAGALLIHLEAGVRSFDRSMVEERNRIEVDRLADIRLAPTVLSQWFLSQIEGFEPAGCPVVGNLVVDALRRFSDKEVSSELPARTPEQGNTALLTLHRPDTVDMPTRLQGLLNAMGTLPMQILFPVHPRTRGQLEDLWVPPNIELMPPLSYPKFCALLRKATVVLTDSGGVQEEAATVGRPCITLRPNTDRLESVLLGLNRLYPPSCGKELLKVVQQAISDAAEDKPAAPERRVSPYGDGHTAERITVLLELLDSRSPSFDLDRVQGLAHLQELEEAVRFVRERPQHLRIVG